jgi:prevent-host-death family protein
MCYMAGTVNVRELRQNLSKYLRRVREGETLKVLDRGHPTALLTPLPEHATALDRLIASGRAIPARRDFTTLGPPLKRRGRRSLSAALAEQREED